MPSPFSILLTLQQTRKLSNRIFSLISSLKPRIDV